MKEKRDFEKKKEQGPTKDTMDVDAPAAPKVPARLQELKLRYYELMVQIHEEKDDLLEICRGHLPGDAVGAAAWKPGKRSMKLNRKRRQQIFKDPSSPAAPDRRRGASSRLGLPGLPSPPPPGVSLPPSPPPTGVSLPPSRGNGCPRRRAGPS